MVDRDTRRVYVHGPGRWPYIAMFQGHGGYTPVVSVEESDIVVWTGGADVEPRLYGELPLPETFFQRERDQNDKRMYQAAGPNRLKVGICRGGQLLNVLNGGKMWQDVDDHTSHHQLIDLETKESVIVTSTHHQMMRPAAHGRIIGIAHQSTIRKAQNEVQKDPTDDDIEVVWYSDTRSLCFQPHPEFTGSVGRSTRDYFFKLLDRYWMEGSTCAA